MVKRSSVKKSLLLLIAGEIVMVSSGILINNSVEEIATMFLTFFGIWVAIVCVSEMINRIADR